METIQDFEDMLFLLNKHGGKYLIVGGLAFIYHAKPRYTKDIDIWIDPAPENVKKVNEALDQYLQSNSGERTDRSSTTQRRREGSTGSKKTSSTERIVFFHLLAYVLQIVSAPERSAFTVYNPTQR